MADQSLEIMLKVLADTTGIKLTQEQFESLKASMVDVGSVAEKTGEEMKAAGDSFLPESLKELPDAQKKAGESMEETGHHAANARLQHMALHHAISELNKVSPELGTSLNMLMRGMHGLGESADGTSAKMAALLDTVGPLLIVMLSIQAVTTYWELYRKKVEEVEAAQVAAMKKIEESTKSAFKAQQELYEAMHPKPDAVKAFEKEIKSGEQAIEGNLEIKLAALEEEKKKRILLANSPEEKAAVTEQFRIKSEQAKLNAEQDKINLQNRVAAEADALVYSNQSKSKTLKQQSSEAAKEIPELEKQKEEVRNKMWQDMVVGSDNSQLIAKADKAIAEIDEKIKDAQNRRINANAGATALDIESRPLVGFGQGVVSGTQFSQTGLGYKRGAEGVREAGEVPNLEIETLKAQLKKATDDLHNIQKELVGGHTANVTELVKNAEADKKAIADLSARIARLGA